MRKCEVRVWERGGEGKTVLVAKTGLFHQWASDYTEFEAGPGNMTQAIVEMEDGTIVMVHPTMVRFL